MSRNKVVKRAWKTMIDQVMLCVRSARVRRFTALSGAELLSRSSFAFKHVGTRISYAMVRFEMVWAASGGAFSDRCNLLVKKVQFRRTCTRD